MQGFVGPEEQQAGVANDWEMQEKLSHQTALKPLLGRESEADSIELDL